MNRKLHNTILAFSVTGVILVAGLMAAHPVLPDGMHHALAQATPAVQADATVQQMQTARIEASAARAAALAARIEERGRRYEAEVARAESFEHALASTAGFVAAVATEAAVAGALGELGTEAGDAIEAADERRETRARRGSVRSAIAVPYFSFARGTGRGDRS